MNLGMIVGTGLFLTALAGFGWQGYDGWLALTEIAAEAQAVGWWAQIQATNLLQFVIGCELSAECRTMLHTFVPTRTTVWSPLWMVSGGVAVAGALTLAVSKPKKGAPYGARFARVGDVRQLVLKALSEPRHAFLLGRLGGKVIAAQRGRTPRERKTQPVLGHILTVAPSQTGKSYSLAANALYTRASLVIVDIKGEQHRLSSGFRATLGKVVVLSPEGVGGGYDPFADLGTDVQSIERAAWLVTHDPHDRDPYWAEAASYGVAAAIRAAQLEGIPPLSYLHKLLRQAHGSGRAFVEALATVPDDLTAEFLETFLGMPPEAMSDEHFNAPRGHVVSVWNALVKRTKPYLLPGVLTLTSKADFQARDLLIHTTTVYLVWPEHELESLSGPLNLILTALITALARETDKTPGSPHRPVILALDEAGRVRVPNLPAHSATLAGRNVSLALYVQALDQLWDTYGLNGGETILSNCHHKVFHGALSLKTAEYISRNLGQKSVSEERRSRAPGWFAPETITQGYTTRHLLTPDEVRMLGRDEVIVLSRDATPIRGKRLGFPDLKVLRERAQLSPTLLARLELPDAIPISIDEETPRNNSTNMTGEHMSKNAAKQKQTDQSPPRTPKRYIDPEEA